MALKEFIDRYIRQIIAVVILIIFALVIVGGALLMKSQPPAIIDPSSSFLTDNPIVSRLPYQDPYYNISYKTDSQTTNQITLTIRTPSPRYRYTAIGKLQSWGYDPTDYKIEFIDYKNPLEK
ncbi:MAG: hypothetical protein ABIQ04_04425 [Candidatus Saccharimonadales bacterium]